MINRKILLENDYHEHPVHNIWGGPYASGFFQKKVCDKRGTKYFINTYEYDQRYEFRLQFEFDDFTLNLNMFSIGEIPLSGIEQYIEQIWVALGKRRCDYD